MSFLRKLAESIENPAMVMPESKAEEKSVEKKLEAEAKEDITTGGQKDATVKHDETVTKVSAARDIEFYDKVGCALTSTKVKRKLKKFSK